MNLVQIATSVEHGAYYYDFLTCKIYHVPYEDLLNLNEVRFSNLLGWMLGSSMAMIGVIHYAQDMQLKQNFATLFFLVVGLVLSAAIIVWGIKRNQKRISDAGVMMIAILQPFGKIAAYFTIKKRGY